MNLLSVKSKLTPLQDKTNVVHCFSVPEGVRRIVVEYEYSPKTIENKEIALKKISDGLEKYGVETDDKASFLPVQNLVTLSFDENGSYRGACHRPPNRQMVVIADKESTAGIINRRVQSGEWQVVLNLHYVGCDICYSVEVEGVE